MDQIRPQCFNGTLWAATDAGISCFDGEQWQALAFPPSFKLDRESGSLRVTGPLDSLTIKLKDGVLKDQALLAKRNADRLLQLVNQLLDLRKLQAGKLQLQLTEDDIVRFVSGIVTSLQAAATQKQLTLSCTTSVPHLTTSFDPDKLEKVLINVISNAIKFTPAQGGITVSIKPHKPIETHEAGDLDAYRYQDSHVFIRRYQNGLVLINPTATEGQWKFDGNTGAIDQDIGKGAGDGALGTPTPYTVKLDRRYIDSLTGEIVEGAITMPPLSGKILLIKPSI